MQDRCANALDHTRERLAQGQRFTTGRTSIELPRTLEAMARTMRRDPIPLTVIGGFLGAGKTTLLNRLLERAGERRLAVLVNDFGAINIDSELIASRAGQTINLTNGCVCCTLEGELLQTLAGLRDGADPPEHIVIEASGISDPSAIAAYGNIPGFQLDGTVVLVDAHSVRERAGHDQIAPDVQRQLRSANLLVLNKRDLVDTAALEATRAWLRELAPYAGVVDAAYGDVALEILLGAGDQGTPAAAEVHHRDHAHGSWDSWSWDGPEPVDGTALARALPELPEGVLRGKGVLHLAEEPDTRFVLQLVGRTFYIKRQGGWQGSAPGSSVVLIGLPGSVEHARLDAMMAGLTGH